MNRVVIPDVRIYSKLWGTRSALTVWRGHCVYGLLIFLQQVASQLLRALAHLH